MGSKRASHHPVPAHLHTWGKAQKARRLTESKENDHADMSSLPSLPSAKARAMLTQLDGHVPARRTSNVTSVKAAYAIATLLSAVLLFMVQLIMGKLLLPWFGGTPAVWTTCMLFFQLLLLAGYGYAHLVDRYLPVCVQGRLHALLIVASLVLVGCLGVRWHGPLLPPPTWQPSTPVAPVASILWTLLVAAGVPFFILSATSPLLHRWYARVTATPYPYRLYALSNIGSLLGLLSYPFLIEPSAALPMQATLWTALYAVFALVCTACAWRVTRLAHDGSLVTPAAPGGQPIPLNPDRHPGAVVFGLWLLLSAGTCSMLLAVTNLMCQETSVIPFLWVLPLGIYLLSFVICFENPRWYWRRWYIPACAVLTVIALNADHHGLQLDIPVLVLSYSVFLFVFCMTCHGELVMLRPVASQLTLFYLAVSLGGALGGLFVGLVAPAIFRGFWEFQVTLLVGWIVLALVFTRDKRSFFYTGDPQYVYLLLLLANYVGARYLLLPARAYLEGVSSAQWALLQVVSAVVLTAAEGMLIRRRSCMRATVWPRIAVGAIIFLVECFLVFKVKSTGVSTLDTTRNFYGVVRVQARTASAPGVRYLQLTHGYINHGFQYMAEDLRRQPAGYCVRQSGAGLALACHRRRADPANPQPLMIGVTGLGAGALAAYAGKQDAIRFYEINPAVVKYAAGPSAYFSYIRDCPGKVNVVLGDARLMLTRELAQTGPQGFDVLLLDAFSSDAVPAHLLTVEAFDLYLRHLRDDHSIIAVNISNRFLDLRPLVFSLASHFHLYAGLFITRGAPPVPTPSMWVLLSRDAGFFAQDQVRDHRTPYFASRSVLWTDKYSNLFGLVRCDSGSHMDAEE